MTMGNLQNTTSMLGMGLAMLIFLLLRKDHLYVSHGLFWITVALTALVFGFSPALIDYLANSLGIAYPPSLLLVLGAMVLFVKALYADILNTQLERQLRLLNQRLAIIEADLRRHEDI